MPDRPTGMEKVLGSQWGLSVPLGWDLNQAEIDSLKTVSFNKEISVTCYTTVTYAKIPNKIILFIIIGAETEIEDERQNSGGWTIRAGPHALGLPSIPLDFCTPDIFLPQNR